MRSSHDPCGMARSMNDHMSSALTLLIHVHERRCRFTFHERWAMNVALVDFNTRQHVACAYILQAQPWFALAL